MEPQVSQTLLPVIPALDPSSETTIETPNYVSGLVSRKRFRADEIQDEQTAESKLTVPDLGDRTDSSPSDYSELLPGWKASPEMYSPDPQPYVHDTAALTLCLERLAILEAENLELKAKGHKLKHDLGLAYTEIQKGYRGELMELLQEELSCAICSDVLIEPAVIQCGHAFCFHCISVWIEQRRIQSNNKPPCPSCRAEIGSVRKVRVYAGFFGRVYSLLSPQEQKNRKQILGQRHREREHWEAEQLVLRAEQEDARQVREDEESLHAERRARAEARARQYTRHSSRFIYEKAFKRFMDLEMRGETVNPAQHRVANQRRLAAALVRYGNVSNPTGSHQPAPEAANEGMTGGRGGNNLHPERENQLNVSGQQEPAQVESLTQDP